MELSTWGRDYGAALCLAPDRAAVPFDRLTDAEQQCVAQVGTGAEARLEAHFGLDAVPAPTPFARYRVTSPAGADLGTLTFAGGAVNWCVPREAPNCGPVGYGHDGLDATMRMLQLLGMTAQEVQS